jgi:NAD(P)-dependent dehydrogenase (short-subunit alcohol dehydrogenase family)
MELSGRAALITGGAKIGRAVALRLAKEGCHVALTYRASRRRVEETAAACREWGVKTAVIRADVRRNRDADRTLSTVRRAFGRMDVLVNMASVYEKSSLSNDAVWKANLDTDLEGTYRFSMRAASLLKRHGTGRIVNFSDWLVASERPRYREYLPYYVAKAGVKGLTEALALELAPEILVNAVAPGPIEGPPEMTAKEIRLIAEQTPLKRWGGADEIAKAVLFLIESDFVTGECLRVDGGRHLY